MNIAHSLSAIALTGCLAVSTPFTPRDVTQGALLPMPENEIWIEVSEEKEPSLWEMVSAVGAASGVHIVATGEDRTELENTATGLDRSFMLPAEDAWTITQQILAQSLFTMARLNDGDATTVSILGRRRVESIAAAYTAIAVEEFDEAARNPGLLVEVFLELPNTDVRVLCNQARVLSYDRSTFSAVALTSSSLLVRGTGGIVSQACRNFLAADAANLAANEAREVAFEASGSDETASSDA